MKQEQAFLAALGQAEGYQLNGETLSIRVRGSSQPLQFVKAAAAL